jgi:cysteine-rich repeat protein
MWGGGLGGGGAERPFGGGDPLEPRCGDGHVDPGEECDDGNTRNGDGCSAACHHEPVCGNGRVEVGEACDDGNTEPGDGCSPGCVEEECSREPDNCPFYEFCTEEYRCRHVWFEMFDTCSQDLLGVSVDTPSGTFTCIDAPLIGLSWAQNCRTTSDCDDAFLYCGAAEAGVDRFCLLNTCGWPENENGELFGGCNADAGTLAGGNPPNGTCEPWASHGLGLCWAGGPVPPGGACKGEGSRSVQAYACEAGLSCLYYEATHPLPCGTDADCAETPVGEWRMPGYCDDDGFCRPWGTCEDLCDAEDPGASAAAGCTDPVGSCVSLELPSSPVDLGYCVGRCQLFGAPCPDFPAGEPRACFPTFADPADPDAGQCLAQTDAPRPVGAPWDPGGALDCVGGAYCLDDSGDGFPGGTCRAWCACPGGFDAEGRCPAGGTDPACPGEEACMHAVSGSSLGFCLPGRAEPARAPARPGGVLVPGE